METLANLDAFVHSADAGSFSAAARRLGLTPAAVSRNVAQLEASLGVRLFQRSTRKLTLTEAGERFLANVGGGLDTLRAAVADLRDNAGQPAGTLRVSVATAFGLDYLLPLLPSFMARYPAVLPEWHFDNRQVDLIADGFDAAIGGGIELTPGVVARELARAHLIVVAAPAYMVGRVQPQQPGDLAELDGIARRSPQSGKLIVPLLRHRDGAQQTVTMKTRLVVSDPEAMCRAALLGLGVAVVPVAHVLPHLHRGALLRLLPQWHADVGAISIYFNGGNLLPAKTRAFVDYMVEAFTEKKLARQLLAI